MRRTIFILLSFTMLYSAGCTDSVSDSSLSPRTIVTTDGEVDDIDSFIRMLLYSNDMDIEAIVYSSSKHHWAGDGKGTLLLPQNRYDGPQTGAPMADPVPKESHRWIGLNWIQEQIDRYEQCYPNLLKHDKNYPSPDYLRSILKVGNIVVEGDMTERTEGSEFIKDIMLDDEPGPLFIQLWGGTNTVARALLSIEEDYKDTDEWESIHSKVSEKVVLNIIQDQDGTYRNYVASVWPDIRTVYNENQFLSFAYLWNSTVPEPMKEYLSGDWFIENINEGHGPLAAGYLGLGSGYDLGDPEDHFGNPQMAQRMRRQIHEFISEGDSPAYFLLLDWGLRSLEHPEWGGLGGRFNPSAEDAKLWKDPQRKGGFSLGRRGRSEEKPAEKITFDRNTGDYNPYTGEVDMFYPQTRWVKVLQNDFAARADWCVKEYNDANHAPSASVKGGLDATASPGDLLTFKASAVDPDGDDVNFRWWQYREAGTSDGELMLNNEEGAEVLVTLPDDVVPGTTLHLILEASDNGVPSLTHFQRIIITVK